MMLFSLIILLVLQRGPDEAGPQATAFQLIQAATAGDGAAARLLYVPYESSIDYLNQRVEEIASGKFKGARGTVVHAQQRGDLAIVESEWDYRGHRVWDVMYLVRREDRWLVFPSDGPPLIDHMVTDVERGDFRALVEAHEPRRRERLEAVPESPGADDPLAAACDFQAAINARDSEALQKMCVRSTIRLADGIDRRLKEMNEGFYGSGELAVEASKLAGTACVVIFRARSGDQLSERRSLLFVRRGQRWYLLPDFYGGNHTAKEFSALHQLGQWGLEWEHRPGKRGPAPTRDLAAIWASEEMPHAAWAGDFDRVNTLLKLGGKSTSQALDAALEEPHWAVAERLVQAGAELNGPNREGWPLLGQLIAHDQVDQAKWVIERGRGKLSKQDLAEPLYIACQQAELELVQLLLDAGADPCERPRHGVPVLFAAVERRTKPQVDVSRRIQLIDLLIKAGADPLARANTLHESLLAEACGYRSDPAIVRHLLNLNIFNEAAKQEAFRSNLLDPYFGVLQMLIDAGVSIEEMDRKEGVLLSAVYDENPDAVHWLLDHGADPNARKESETALLAAVRSGSSQMVEAMLIRGGDPRQTNDKGEDAFAIARARLAREPASGEARGINDLLSEWRARQR